MGDVIDFGGETTKDLSVEEVLEGARDCDDILILGWKGDDFYCATSNAQYSANLLLLEIAKRAMLDVILGDWE